MGYVIRECRLDDGEGIYALNIREMGYDYPLELTVGKIGDLMGRKSDRIWVAVDLGRVVGYVHGNSYDVIYAPHMKNIMGIAVDSSYKRMGIGRALLQEVEKWAKEEGALGVRLVSSGTRKGAHEFYRNCGYGSEKEQVNFKKVCK